MSKPAGSVQAAVVSDVSSWDKLEEEWESLFVGCDNASAPLAFAWLRTWWSVYGKTYADAGEGLRLLTIRRHGHLIGVLPMYQSTSRFGLVNLRRLRLLSTGEREEEETCAEYLDLLCRRDDAHDCVTAAAQVLDGMRWDSMQLLNLPAGSPLAGLALRTADVSSTAVTSAGVCPVADLSDGFEAYLGRLSANSRQQARRLLRQADAAGAQFRLADADSLASAFAGLVRLHQAHWQREGKPGCFAAQRFIDFHRALAHAWVPAGRAIVASVTLAGETLAVLYGFVVRDRFEFYQSGVSRTEFDGVKSPGMLAHLLLMRQLAQDGVRTYDLLRGTAQYKTKLATGESGLIHVEVWRATTRAGLLRVAQPFAQRLGRRIGRSIAGR